MGEAKKRGSAQERLDGGTANRDAALAMLDAGKAEHYCLVLDRSERGKRFLDSIHKAPPDFEFRQRVESSAFQMWDMTGFEYCMVWGTFGYTGGLTLPCKDLEALLSDGLVAVMERTNEKGGMCVFLLGTDEAQHDAIMGRVAELQPAAGTPGPRGRLRPN